MEIVVVNGMYYSTCAKEEQGFEHGVCEQVEHGGHETQAFVATVA